MGKRPAFFVSTCKLLLAGALIVVFANDLSAQRRHVSGPLDTLGEEVSQAEGLEILKAFRQLGIAGEYRLSFQLEVREHREPTRRMPGVLLGTQTPYGPLSRVDVALEPADVSDIGELIPARVERMLLQNGLFANALQSSGPEGPESEARLVEASRYFESVAGSEITIFDLLMPFTFWQDFKYEGRMGGSRPLQVFTLYPPLDDAKLRENVSRVRIFLDDEFNALNRVEVYDAEEELVKMIWIRAFKIVDGQGLPSQIDVTNKQTKDKALFKVIDAAVGVDAPDWVFTPEGLQRNVYGTEVALRRGSVGAE